MNILLFEYITGGGMVDKALPDDLAREGRLMRDTLIHELDNHTLTIPVDVRVHDDEAFRECGGIHYHRVDSAAAFEHWWGKTLQGVDLVWLIAPETEGILAMLSTDAARAAPGKLLGSFPETVALATDKQLTYEHLRSQGIECVPSWRLSDFIGQVPPPWVIKPRDGVGCEGVHKLWSLPPHSEDDLIQPYLEGDMLSLSMLCDEGHAVLLAVNRQLIEEREEGFHLSGCLVNTIADHKGDYQWLCHRIAAALPGLWGYVGVDLILHDGVPLVLEINPRLTLSYVGLSEALGENLADLIISLKKRELSLDDIARWRNQSQGTEVWVAKQ